MVVCVTGRCLFYWCVLYYVCGVWVWLWVLEFVGSCELFGVGCVVCFCVLGFDFG